MSYPDDVGIKDMELYFPSYFVDQAELETFDGVSAGKYTIGLGQARMGFCSDREDVNSLALTVTQRLIERVGLDLTRVGFLAVGTETLIDKSKSTKSVLMQLFADSGNFDVEGVDCKNACYGGTAALFHALDWVESSSWDGRLALVVAADIAVYAQGPARCTGGAGSVALLVGPEAALVVERGLRSSVMQHVYDFFKPDLSSEYPTVDGPLSIRCYLSALDRCYRKFLEKLSTKEPQASLASVDFCCFHAPFAKLVQKSFARLVFLDAKAGRGEVSALAQLAKFASLPEVESYADRDLERTAMAVSAAAFAAKCQPSLLVSRNVGNMYTPSLYGCLASLIASVPAERLSGARLLMFSYGSGLASSVYALRVTAQMERLHALTASLQDLPQRLESRLRVNASDFASTMQQREERLHQAPCQPQASIDDFAPGTFYLTDIDDLRRRRYGRKPSAPHDFVNGDGIVNH